MPRICLTKSISMLSIMDVMAEVVYVSLVPGVLKSWERNNENGGKKEDLNERK